MKTEYLKYRDSPVDGYIFISCLPSRLEFSTFGKSMKNKKLYVNPSCSLSQFLSVVGKNTKIYSL